MTTTLFFTYCRYFIFECELFLFFVLVLLLPPRTSLHNMIDDEWDDVVQRISSTMKSPLGDVIPWFNRPSPLSPPLSPRTRKTIDVLEGALYQEITWRDQLPLELTLKLQYGIGKILTNNRFRDKLQTEEAFNEYVESIDRTMLSVSNSLDEYIDMTSFTKRIASAIKYKTFINKVTL
jgi:hypothetical protein